MIKKSGVVMIGLAMPDIPARDRRVMDSCDDPTCYAGHTCPRQTCDGQPWSSRSHGGGRPRRVILYTEFDWSNSNFLNI